MRLSWRAGVRVVLGLAMLSVLAAGCSNEREPREPRLAPDFTLSSTDGNRVHLSDYRGKVVLLDFWATWCPPCRAGIPHMVELQNKYRADGFVVLGMNMDQNPEDLVAFLSRTTVNYPTLKIDAETLEAYGGVSSIPLTLLIDKQGKIRERYLGYDNRIAEQMERAIQALLQEKG
jgi:thiol-disulfide isomerase/thioredoxin